VGFLIEVPTSFSSIEIIAKKKWRMAHTERHPPKEIGWARPIFKFHFALGDPPFVTWWGVAHTVETKHPLGNAIPVFGVKMKRGY